MMNEEWVKPPFERDPALDGGEMSEPALGRAAWLPVLETLPLYLWESNIDLRFSYTSGGVSRITGRPAAQRVGMQMLEGTTDRIYAGPRFAAHHDIITSREGFANFCFEKQVGDRDAVLMVSATPRFDAQGDYAGLRGATLDLTQAVRLAAGKEPAVAALAPPTDAMRRAIQHRNSELENANRLLVEVLDEMGEGLLVTSGERMVDPDNRILIVNPAYRALFDLTEDQIYPGQTMGEFIQHLAARGDAIAPEDFGPIEQRLLNGETVMLQVPSRNKHFMCKAMRRPSGGFVLVHSDVTKLQTQNHALARARDEAKVASRTKSRFLATMSHEIRTPMNGVVGMADLLALTNLDAEQAGYVRTIRRSAIALTELITGLLDFSKIEAGKMEFQRKPFVLRDLIADVTELITPLAQTKGLGVQVVVADHLPEHVFGDAARLRQVLVNLAGNAVKFTSDGEISLHVDRNADGATTLAVSDTGVGIAPDMQARVFDPFVQAEGGLARGFEGSGLGLAITSKLVTGMGGTLDLHSVLGQGSTFTVALDLPDAALSLPKQERRKRARHPDDDPCAVDLTGRHILLAEDNLTNQKVVARMLTKVGARVTVAEDGARAIAALQTGTHFDAVLMDLSMPVMSGLDATRTIRHWGQDHPVAGIPIVALTGNAFESDRAACLEAGMNGFLTKPVRMAALVGTLSSHLGPLPKRRVQPDKSPPAPAAGLL